MAARTKHLIDTTIRLRGIWVGLESERHNPYLRKPRWQVPMEDDAVDAFLCDLGYPQRMTSEDVLILIEDMMGLNNTVVIEPGDQADPERDSPGEPTIGNEVV
jgi:hypothetical protein